MPRRSSMFKTCCGDCGECWYVGNPRTCTCPDETTKRTWVGLTDEEITELHHEIKVRLMGTYKTKDIYRAIEAKLKAKNERLEKNA